MIRSQDSALICSNGYRRDTAALVTRIPTGPNSPRAAGAVPSSEVMARGVPVGRMGTGDDIAAACLYLVSEEASYVTGQTVSVNGGSFVGW